MAAFALSSYTETVRPAKPNISWPFTGKVFAAPWERRIKRQRTEKERKEGGGPVQVALSFPTVRIFLGETEGA